MLNLDFIYCTAVNYAILQNHVPVVRKLALGNTDTLRVAMDVLERFQTQGRKLELSHT